MHSRTPSFLQVEPQNEITFNYIPRKYLSSSLRLINVADHPVAFKVKTNVPVCYLVKPHSGTLPPKSSIEINITMQPTEYNPQNASISDKFLVNAIPLDKNVDLDSLSDANHFQQAWASVPKERVQGHKLKVVLKFENLSRSSTTGNKNTESDTPKDNEKEFLTDSARKDLESSDFKSMAGDMSFREELGSSNLMTMSFSGETSMGSSKGIVQRILQQPEINLTSSQERIMEKRGAQEREQEKKASVLPVKEEKNVSENNKLLEEKVQLLEKRIDELTIEKKLINQRYQEFLGKGEEQKKLLFELSEENTRLKSELSNLKRSTFHEKTIKKGQSDGNTYELWHVLVVAILAMIIGAFLSAK